MMQAWLGQLDALFAQSTAENWILFVGWLVALSTFILSALAFQRQKGRERRIELQENYLRLELESNAVFRFEAEHGAVLDVYKQSVRPANYGAGLSEEELTRRQTVADNFFLQQLNLFEIAARFRRDKVFAPNIFGSWVVWYHDVTRSWWFREKWEREYSDNYTEDLFFIFTPMSGFFNQVAQYGAISDQDDDPFAAELKDAFFHHVAVRFNCPVVLDWLKRRQLGASPSMTRAVRKLFLPLGRLSWKVRHWPMDSESLGPKARKILRRLAAGSANASA